MYATVRDVMQTERMKNFKPIAGSGGLGNRVSHITILDFEFARPAGSSSAGEYWETGDFVASSLQFAKNNESAILRAVKKLCAAGTSGLAINNVFSLDIGSDVIRFANANDYPILLASDSRLYFEDIVISVSELIKSLSDAGEAERRLHFILKGAADEAAVRKTALEVNYTFQNAHFCAYFHYRDREDLDLLPALLSAETKRPQAVSGSSLVKYQDGFFHIFSTNRPRQTDRAQVTDRLCSDLGLRKSRFYIGISDMHDHLTRLRTSLLQSLYASAFCRVCPHPTNDADKIYAYDELGLYRNLFPFASTPWAEAYREAMIAPIVEHDAGEKQSLLDFVLTYEAFRGNNREIAASLGVHENTVRYRIGKVRELLGFSDDDPTFDEELFSAVKLHRIHATLGDELSF